MATSAQDLAARFPAERAAWRALVAKVPPERMDEPGAMGEWTFRDTVSHLAAWRRRTIGRLEAAARGEPRPPNPWPAGTDGDKTNDWFREQDANRHDEPGQWACGTHIQELASVVHRTPQPDEGAESADR